MELIPLCNIHLKNNFFLKFSFRKNFYLSYDIMLITVWKFWDQKGMKLSILDSALEGRLYGSYVTPLDLMLENLNSNKCDLMRKAKIFSNRWTLVHISEQK